MAREERAEERPGRRRKKKGHRLYAFFVIMFGLVIICLSVLVLFYVQKIEVKGNEYVRDSEIAETVQNDRFSINTIYIWAKYKLGYGKQLPCVEEMKVSIRLPWVLKVEVKERPIVGCFAYGEKEYAYFGREGMIVKKGGTYEKAVPCVEGIDMEDPKLYKPIKSKNSKLFGEILEASQELEKYKLSAGKIVCQGENIYVYMGKVCVSLGTNVTAEKIAQIPPILEKLGDKEGTLHLENYYEGNGTITFKKGELPKEKKEKSE